MEKQSTEVITARFSQSIKASMKLKCLIYHVMELSMNTIFVEASLLFNDKIYPLLFVFSKNKYNYDICHHMEKESAKVWITICH